MNALKNLFCFVLVTTGIGLFPAQPATAQSFSVLHTFTGFPTDGSNPLGGLTASGNTFYGTTRGGLGSGTMFRINPDGMGYTNVFVFTNQNAGNPSGELLPVGDTFYGTTGGSGSGNTNWGTVFAIKTNGTGFSILHNFRGGTSDGVSPGGLVLAGDTLYGITDGGGTFDDGTIFKVKTDGTGFGIVYNFYRFSTSGYRPRGTLVLSGNTLYGTTFRGGSVFAVNTNGTGYTVLHTFSSLTTGLLLAGNTLYGTTPNDGVAGKGMVFAVRTDGTGFTNLHNFTATSGTLSTNDDGATPFAPLIISSNMLYGTASLGGRSGKGTVFALNTDGTGFTNLYNFTATTGPNAENSDGANPSARLTILGTDLYGVAEKGGSEGGGGTVFRISFGPETGPELKIALFETNVVLTWPVEAAGFTLQASTNLPATTWISVSPVPVIVNGWNAVTNQISAAQSYYRLAK